STPPATADEPSRRSGSASDWTSARIERKAAQASPRRRRIEVFVHRRKPSLAEETAVRSTQWQQHEEKRRQSVAMQNS
uniref:HMG box domain-containing protein n=1 Tax=Macrostomum lignano TaxID=282301 RepID=A0A1I8FFZ5_9PLAT